jgi:phage repressor protein C with HTH and peptisase S24 domain
MPGNSNRNSGRGREEKLQAERAAFVARLTTVARYWPSVERLARATGVSPSAFRKWLKGEAEPSRERLVALADAAHVRVAWLVRGEGPEPLPQDLAHSPLRGGEGEGRTGIAIQNFLVLPPWPDAAAAGSGRPSPPNPGEREFIAFRHDWIRSTFGREPGDVILETAAGESMEPGIHDGDLLLVDVTDRQFRNFGVYVLDVRGERLVKRVQRKFDGSLILISDNQLYQAESIPADLAKEVSVVGRVIWRAGKV